MDGMWGIWGSAEPAFEKMAQRIIIKDNLLTSVTFKKYLSKKDILNGKLL